MPFLAVSGAPLTKQRLGRIKGSIRDINQARVLGAEVIVDGPEIHRRLFTDEYGEFEIAVPPGTYRIAIESNGFHRFRSEDIEVKRGKTQTMKIQLKVLAPMSLVPATAPVG